MLLLAAALALAGYRNARADPVVRRLAVKLPGWPAGAAPVRAVLLSDIHIGGHATDAARLDRIVRQVNALRPDLVLIAGDFVAGHDPAEGARAATLLTRPLAALHPPMGIVAVLGNHDYWTSETAVRRALTGAGVTVLANQALRRGPLVLIGIDDDFTHRADIARSLAAAAGLRGSPVVLTHTPDIAPSLPAGSAPLVLAGHTHCGQVVLPLIGPALVYSPLLRRRLYDPRYRCGLVRDSGRAVVVTGGIGASLSLRFGAPPDLWLLTLGP